MRCTLTPEELASRGERWRSLGPADIADLKNGLRLIFPAHVEAELRELARLEHTCCAFASWDVGKQGDHVLLDITAEGDAVAAVQSLFRSMR
jgi:hypothetical protein